MLAYACACYTQLTHNAVRHVPWYSLAPLYHQVTQALRT